MGSRGSASNQASTLPCSLNSTLALIETQPKNFTRRSRLPSGSFVHYLQGSSSYGFSFNPGVDLMLEDDVFNQGCRTWAKSSASPVQAWKHEHRRSKRRILHLAPFGPGGELQATNLGPSVSQFLYSSQHTLGFRKIAKLSCWWD